MRTITFQAAYAMPPRYTADMSEVSQILSGINRGDPHAAGQLLPLIYDELRRLAAQKLAHESPGQTLQPTALVHEAFLRLVPASSSDSVREGANWDGRGHFFAAAAESMRRILIDNARRKLRHKHGGELVRVDLPDEIAETHGSPERLVALDAALTRLATEDAAAAEVVNLHFFAGQSLEDVARMTGVSRATAYRQWTYARSWLKIALEGELS